MERECWCNWLPAEPFFHIVWLCYGFERSRYIQVHMVIQDLECKIVSYILFKTFAEVREILKWR